ncbi:MAG: hypothetical protein KJ749_04795 [Planctomycetes bacterium]|nr:hypothetical protein [Planctomycetota bacterium]
MGAYQDGDDPLWVCNYQGGTCIFAPGTGIIDYEYGCTFLVGQVPDPGFPLYLGTLILAIPANAAGTYEIVWNTNIGKTFFNDQNANKIPLAHHTPGLIEIPTGKCCSALPNWICEDGLSETQCATRTAPALWLRGADCTVDWPGGVDNPCCTCVSDSGCNDMNVCTTDTCQNCTCYSTPNYDPAYCCAPWSRALTLIDDDDQCTTDICNEDGSVDHIVVADGTACDDGNSCTIDDVCTAGICAGDGPDDLMTECVTADDCPTGWFCDDEGGAMDGYCNCRLSTPLCVEYEPGCYEAGAAIVAELNMGIGSEVITGGQFVITYDPDCVEYVGYEPGVFPTVMDYKHTLGSIWYVAVALDPADPEVFLGGTTGPATIATFNFVKLLDECDPCGICLVAGTNPYLTRIVKESGNAVGADLCPCESDIVLEGDVTLVVPEGGAFNADCGLPTAIVEWDAAYAEDTCDGELDVVCVSEHDGGVPIGHLINGGGEFPQGKSYFACTATNSCDVSVTKIWTVDLSDQQTMDVQVHLLDVVAGAFSRCICFEAFLSDCSGSSTVCSVMDFGPPWNFRGHARDHMKKLDKGNFFCIEANDPLHTLRSMAAIECVDGIWTAMFKGDPLVGGNGLVGGNLDKFKGTEGSMYVIDVLDAGMYMAEIATGATYANGNTTCETEGPHGDINADGNVDSLDYNIIVENFLMMAKDGCCDAISASVEPVLDISVKELRAMGYGELVVADLNQDGRLNMEDMNLYSQGVQPQTVERVKRGSSR